MKMGGHDHVTRQKITFMFPAIIQSVDDDSIIDFIHKYWEPRHNGAGRVIEGGFHRINLIFFSGIPFGLI